VSNKSIAARCPWADRITPWISWLWNRCTGVEIVKKDLMWRSRGHHAHMRVYAGAIRSTSSATFHQLALASSYPALCFCIATNDRHLMYHGQWIVLLRSDYPSMIELHRTGGIGLLKGTSKVKGCLAVHPTTLSQLYNLLRIFSTFIPS
jgi:hypothetical protein